MTPPTQGPTVFRKKKESADRRPRYDFRPRSLHQMLGTQPAPATNRNLQLESANNGNNVRYCSSSDM